MWKAERVQKKEDNRKFSKKTALLLGLAATLEIMIGAGMIFNIDFRSVDVVALLFGFVVLYSGMTAILTDN